MALSHSRIQTLVIAAVCIAAVGGALYYNDYAGKNSSNDAQNKLAVTPVTLVIPVAIATTTDISNKDWKKEFSSTTAAFMKESSKPGTTTENLTVTDQVGRDFLLSYIQLKQADLVNSTDTVNQAMGDILDNRLDSIRPKTYTLSDITVTTASDAASFARYSAAVSRTIETYNPVQNEAALVTNYLTSSNPTELKGLDRIILSYKAIIGSLTKIPVPKSISAQHIAILNSFSQLESAASDLRVIDSDQIRGMAGTTVHSDAITALLSALQAEQSALAGRGAAFTINKDVLTKLIQ